MKTSGRSLNDVTELTSTATLRLTLYDVPVLCPLVTVTGTWANPVSAHRPAIIVSRSRCESSACT